jgi:hypothetical protein
VSSLLTYLWKRRMSSSTSSTNSILYCVIFYFLTQGEDVNIVYIKGLMNGDTDGDHANFLNKIEHQII